MAIAVDEQRAAEARAFSALNEAHETLLRTAEEIRILQETVLPGAQDAVDQLLAGYETGRVTQLEIIDARRTLTEARTQNLAALADYHKAIAEIEALTAAPVALPRAQQNSSKRPLPRARLDRSPPHGTPALESSPRIAGAMIRRARSKSAASSI